MSNENQPALETPEVEPQVAAAEAAPVVIEEPVIDAAAEIEASGIRAKTFATMAKEPKERIRIPKAAGPQTVVINGARWDVPANVPVEVPATIAQMLRDSGRI